MRWLVAAALLASAATSGAAGFDCGKARTEDERAVCASTELSRLDDEMTAAYRKLWDSAIKYEEPKVQAAFRANQKDWIGLRSRCGDAANCLRDAYRDRIAWLAHPAQRYTGRYESGGYRLFITLDRELELIVRLFRGKTGEDLVLMEKTARFVPAAKAEGEDRIALTVTFTSPYAKWTSDCREMTVDFGAQLEPAIAFNEGCSLFAATPEVVTLKQRSFTYTAPVR